MTAPSQDEEAIFDEARQRPSGRERADFVDQACASNEPLKLRVLELLAAHDVSHGALDQPLSYLNPTLASSHERPGTLIGPYKLLEQIGEGGFGVVFLAEQTHPVCRRVALKVVKPGMDTRQVIARFEAERQALAIMDHPNIAKVFDGGVTSSGRPYFVMELVRGVPITEFCDQNHLTPRQRLELFASVCQAVQHAHQKGIIHRDLKPSNVLVSRHDATPVVKVIDFGVAKALGQKLTDKTVFTSLQQMIGTPLYMSPEQAGMSDLDIDTRSDIYSLGVLLYELLTGATPFTKDRFQQAAYDEILRIIREEEPPKPSTKLSTAEGLPTLAANRGTEPSKLTKLVRGELDWIVMKALEKDRSRRYETASGFARDVERYLNDEQVQACPPSAMYRFRKFARRNKAALAVASLVLFFLVVLGSGVGWVVRDQAARAVERATNLERAVERAELLQREGKRDQALAGLERALLLAREAEPTPPLAGRIDSLQQRLDAEGRDEAFVTQFEAIRREALTEVNVEQSRFRGDNAYAKIRDALEHYGIAVGATPPAGAVIHIQKRPRAVQTVVVAALDECLSFAPRTDAGAREWLIEVLQKADSDPWRSKVRRAWKQPAVLEALAKDIDVRQQPPSFLLLMASFLPVESPSRLDLARRVQFAYPGDFWANHHLAFDLDHAGSHAEAVRYFTAALAIRPDNPGVLLNRARALNDAGELDAAVADLQRAITVSPRYAAAHNNLGAVLRRQKKLDEAVAAYRKAIEITPKRADAHNSLGLTLHDQRKLDDAIAAYRQAIDIDPKYAAAHRNLGVALHDQKKLDEAIAAYRQAIEFDPKLAAAHINLGLFLHDQRNLDEAIAAYRKAIELDPKLAAAHNYLGTALRDQKKLDEALAAYRQAIELDPKLAAAHINLGILLCDDLKEYDKAIERFRKAIELDPKYAIAHLNLGVALANQGRLDEAVAACRKAIELDPKVAKAHYHLGLNLRGQNKPGEAIAAYKKAIELNPTFPQAHNNLAMLLATCSDANLRDPGQAVALAKKAVELGPQTWIFLNTLGIAHYRTGEWRAAIAALEKSMELRKGGDSNDWFFLAMAHWKLGEKDKAREWHDQAVQWMDKNQPKNEELRRFRTEAEELLGLNEKK